MPIARFVGPVIRTGRRVPDNVLFLYGTDGDIGLILDPDAVSANTAVAGVLEGTPVTPVALAANSFILGNITNDGDILLAVSKAGTSYMAFMADASTGDTLLGVPTGASIDFYINGVKEVDYATGALAFQQATTISTTATTLTLSPSTDVHISNAKGLVIGHTAQVTMGGLIPEVQVLGTDADNADSAVAIGMWVAGTDGPRVVLVKSRNATIGSSTIVVNGDLLGAIIWYGDDGGDFSTPGASVQALVDGVPGGDDMPGRLVFFTTADGANALTARWRITQEGVFASGTTDPANLTAAGTVIALGGIGFTDVLNAWIDDATHGDGTTTLYIGNQTINTTSDVRLKENIEPSRMNALAVLGKLPVVDFDWRSSYGAHEAYNRRGRWTGIPAQEAFATVPYIINTNGGQNCAACRAGEECSKHDPWFVQYEHLVPVLVKGFQEVDARFSTVDERLAAVEEANRILRSQLVAAGIVPEE